MMAAEKLEIDEVGGFARRSWPCDSFRVAPVLALGPRGSVSRATTRILKGSPSKIYVPRPPS